MPQAAIKGIFQDGIIIPTEEVPFRENMNVIIVFTDRYNDDESRYYQKDWQTAEKQASGDYRTGSIKSAKTIDQMFDEIERNADGS
ncbi:MAG: hypothetical protein R2941_16530 [Desulfobacterales bacterium]